MYRKISLFVLVLILSLVAAVPAFAGGGRPASDTVVYVTSQDKFFDSIVLGDLPFNGQENFQKLEMTGPSGLQTEFGPGDPGYFGGRWWVDANGNNIMDEADTFFLCPLLGPGRDSP